MLDAVQHKRRIAILLSLRRFDLVQEHAWPEGLATEDHALPRLVKTGHPSVPSQLAFTANRLACLEISAGSRHGRVREESIAT